VTASERARREDVDEERLHTIAALLEGCRFDTSSEVAVQRGLAAVFAAESIEYRREVPVPGGRLDFLVAGEIALEVKLGGSAANLIRQLWRYAELDLVQALLVVTTRHRLARVPDIISGKPVRVALLLGGAF
jgi:hypothetical protein